MEPGSADSETGIEPAIAVPLGYDLSGVVSFIQTFAKAVAAQQRLVEQAAKSLGPALEIFAEAVRRTVAAQVSQRPKLEFEFENGPGLVRLRRKDYATRARARLVALRGVQLRFLLPSAPTLLSSNFPNGPNREPALPSTMAGRATLLRG